MADIGHAHYALTRRQREVASLLAQGFSIPRIAEWLVVSVNTVRTHVKNLHTRTSTHDLVALVRWANEHMECCVGGESTIRTSAS